MIFFPQAIWIFSLVDYKPVTYTKAIEGVYEYPEWAIILGWCVAATSFVPIPVIAIINVLGANADGIWEVKSDWVKMTKMQHART